MAHSTQPVGQGSGCQRRDPARGSPSSRGDCINPRVECFFVFRRIRNRVGAICRADQHAVLIRKPQSAIGEVMHHDFHSAHRRPWPLRLHTIFRAAVTEGQRLRQHPLFLACEREVQILRRLCPGAMCRGVVAASQPKGDILSLHEGDIPTWG